MIDWLAAVLPRKLVLACFNRMVAHAMYGKWFQTSSKAVSHPAGYFPQVIADFEDVTIRTVLSRWDEPNA